MAIVAISNASFFKLYTLLGLTLSPDGRWLLYAQTTATGPT